MWMDWNDPDELRRLRDLLGADPARGHDDRGPGRPGHRHRRDARRAARHARDRRLVLHVQQREQRPHLGLPGRVPPARLAVQGPRHDALVPALRDRPLPDGDERGLPGPRGPGPDRPLPARRPAGRGAARLDDDALDADLERRGGRRRGPALRPGPPGRRPLLARQGHAQDGARRARSRSRRRSPGRDLVGWRYAGPFDDLPAVRGAPFERRPATSTASWPGTRSARTRGPASSTSRPGCGAEDFQLGKALGLPVIAPDRRGRAATSTGFGCAEPAATCRDVAEPIVERPRATRLLLPPRAVPPPLPALLALRDAARSSGSSTSGSSRWARSTTSRARR